VIFCWHKWSKWQEYERPFKWMPGSEKPPAVQGKWFDIVDHRQKRSCEKCGKIQDELISQGHN